MTRLQPLGPDEDTTLKNAEDGERIVALSEDVAEVLADYVDHKRKDREDDHGREPLLPSEKDRLSKSAIQQITYKLTRPCIYSDECPHDKDPDSRRWRPV